MTDDYTPGPWNIGTYAAGNEPARDSEKRVININAEGDIAQISNCNPLQTESERIANARLIAAAPELLYTLECLLEKADREWGKDGEGIWPQTRNDARAAIKKAKGLCE